MKHYIYICSFVILLAASSCDKLLDKEPTSQVSPEKYLNDASQLGYYANGLYTNILPSHSGYSLTFVKDQYTDNQRILHLIQYILRIPGQFQPAIRGISRISMTAIIFSSVFSQDTRKVKCPEAPQKYANISERSCSCVRTNTSTCTRIMETCRL